jgi:predicted ATPase
MIRELALRRFKRFEEERFDLRGHVILAGPNDCGKTTVLQALAAWALGLKRWRELNDFQRHGGAYTKAPLARQAFSAVPLRSYDLLWKDRNYTGALEIEVALADGRQVAMEFHKDSTEQIYVRPAKQADPNVVRSLNLDVVYVATVSGLSVEEPVYQPDYIETLLGRQRPGDVVRNLLLQASRGGEWDQLRAAVQRLFGVELSVPQTLGGQILCEYRQGAAGPSFDILSAGSGFQQVVLLLACLATRRGAVLLVDEPDAHLHVFLQDSIFSELHRAAAETKSQLVIATHSEVIFNSAAPEQICVVMGRPRRLASETDIQKLRQAVSVLQQSDLVAAQAAPGILYLEGYTDLNLMRAWAGVLGHRTADFLNRQPFWKPQVWEPRDSGKGIRVQEHYSALKLVREDLTGVWLVDADGKSRGIPPSAGPERSVLNRVAWTRYETESYLVHPQALTRFIEKLTGNSALEAVESFFTGLFGADLARQFWADALMVPPLIDTFLKNTKARTAIIGALLEASGIHGFDYTRFDEIAAMMLPQEIHPEVMEKLDFIQQAFGL